MSVAVSAFSGNLVRDPEVRQVGEHKVAKFSVAVNRFVKGEKKPSFFDCEAWNKTAEFMEQYVKKGSSVTVISEPRQDIWEDKDTKEKRSKVFFSVQSLQLHDKKQGNQDSQDVPAAANSDADVPF